MEQPITELLQSGVQLMVVGMGIVFLFLALLVGAVSALPRILWRLSGEQAFEQTPPLASTASTLPPTKTAVEPDVADAIQMAIRLYESNQ